MCVGAREHLPLDPEESAVSRLESSESQAKVLDTLRALGGEVSNDIQDMIDVFEQLDRNVMTFPRIPDDYVQDR